MSKMAGPGSLWTKPQLATIMQANHQAADAQEAHALEDILAARQRARARRSSRLMRLVGRVLRRRR
jgi:hypothetical protein